MGNYQGYQKYKDSGVEWLSDIPEHWEVKRIKFLCQEIISGPFGSSLTKDMYTKFGYKIYGQEQVIINDFSIGDYYISEEKYREMIRYAVNPGDILVSCVGTFGKIAVFPQNTEEGIINPRLIKLTLNKQKIKPNYFGILLSSNICFFQFDKLSRGGTMGVVNIGILSMIELPIPPLDEQEKIAQFLDYKTKQIDELIKKKETLIEKLDEKRTSLISHAVTKGLDSSVPMKDSGIEWLGDIPKHWEVKRLNFLTKKIGDGIHSTPNYIDASEYYFINGNNLINGNIVITESTKCVSKDEFDKYNLNLDKDTLLLSINGTIGNLAFYQNELVMLGKSAAYIILKSDIFRKFAYYYLLSKNTKNYFFHEVTGTTIFNLSLKSIKNHFFPTLPLDEQKQIAEYLDQKTTQIDQQKAKIKEAIELLKEYRTSLITNAVTGKIDVRQVAIP